jgi:hypothetical protein
MQSKFTPSEQLTEDVCAYFNAKIVPIANKIDEFLTKEGTDYFETLLALITMLAHELDKIDPEYPTTISLRDLLITNLIRVVQDEKDEKEN